MNHSSRRFRLSIVVEEAFHNTFSRILWPTVLAVCAFVAGFAVPALTALDVGAIEAQSSAQTVAGSNVLVISAEDRAPLSAQRCDRLRSVEGVLSAGGVQAEVTARDSSGSPIHLVYATAGYAAIVWPSSSGIRNAVAGVVAGDLFAREAGLVGPSTLVGLRRDDRVFEVFVDQVMTAPSRAGLMDRSLLVVEPATSTITECFVEAAPGAFEGVEAVAVSWFPREDRTRVDPFVKSGPTAAEIDQAYGRRFSALTAPVGAVLSLLSAMGSWLARRNEFALYQNLGVGPGRRVLMVLTEFVSTTLLATQIGLGLGLLTSLWSPFALQTVAVDLVGLLLLSSVIPAVGLLVLPNGRGLSALRGR